MDDGEGHCYEVVDGVTLCITSTGTDEVRVGIREGDTHTYTDTLDKDRWPKPSTRRCLAKRLANTTPVVDYDDADDALQEALADAMVEDDSELLPPLIRGSPMPLLSLLQLDDRAGPMRPYSEVQVLGKNCPTTDEARRRLRQAIRDAIGDELYRVLNAPTALGKSFTVATEPWLDYPEVTGGEPVIQLHATRDARDEAVRDTRKDGGNCRKMQSRKEACSVARGDHDDELTMNGEPASQWLDRQCDRKGMDFVSSHDRLATYNDQSRELPCESSGAPCPGKQQWTDMPRDGNGDPVVDVIHGTHPFAFVPAFRDSTNLVFDEVPDFALLGPGETDDHSDDDDLTRAEVRGAITAFLREVDAPIDSYDELVAVGTALADGDQPIRRIDEEAVSELKKALSCRPDFAWYFENSNAHALAPALTRAVWGAAKREPDTNGRRTATVEHVPPRPDSEDHDRWACRNWVTVVLDRDNRVTTVRNMPDLSQTRSIIGLDAYPVWELWALNIGETITVETILDRHERQQWRRHERGLWVVQVGDATRPYTSGEFFGSYDQMATKAFFQQLRDEYGSQFQTVITAASVEDRMAGVLREIGVTDPLSMHYGEEKSRNDFGDEHIGAVLGSIDPGDEYVIDILAELGFDAHPEWSGEPCGSCGGGGCRDCLDTGLKRAHGRGFVGPNAKSAEDILASVRENHVAQSAGRYARNADNPRDWALVFVRTNAIPDELVDFQVPGVNVYTEHQQAIMDYLRDNPGSTSREIAEGVVKADNGINSCSKEHVRQTLETQSERGTVITDEEAGAYNADVHTWVGGDTRAAVDLVPEQPTNDDVRDSHTWSLALEQSDVEQSGQ